MISLFLITAHFSPPRSSPSQSIYSPSAPVQVVEKFEQFAKLNSLIASFCFSFTKLVFIYQDFFLHDISLKIHHYLIVPFLFYEVSFLHKTFILHDMTAFNLKLSYGVLFLMKLLYCPRSFFLHDKRAPNLLLSYRVIFLLISFFFFLLCSFLG